MFSNFLAVLWEVSLSLVLESKGWVWFTVPLCWGKWMMGGCGVK